MVAGLVERWVDKSVASTVDLKEYLMAALLAAYWDATSVDDWVWNLDDSLVVL